MITRILGMAGAKKDTPFQANRGKGETDKAIALAQARRVKTSVIKVNNIVCHILLNKNWYQTIYDEPITNVLNKDGIGPCACTIPPRPAPHSNPGPSVPPQWSQKSHTPGTPVFWSAVCSENASLPEGAEYQISENDALG